MTWFQAVLSFLNIIVLGAIAIKGQRLTQKSSAEAVRVSRYKLWLDLMPQRMAWFKELNTGFFAALDPLRSFPLGKERRHIDQNGMLRLYKLYEDAAWLFEAGVQEVVGDIIDILTEMRDDILAHDPSDKQALNGLLASNQNNISICQNKLAAIEHKLREYLYVGSIKRDEEVEASPQRWLRRFQRANN